MAELRALRLGSPDTAHRCSGLCSQVLDLQGALLEKLMGFRVLETHEVMWQLKMNHSVGHQLPKG